MKSPIILLFIILSINSQSSSNDLPEIELTENEFQIEFEDLFDHSTLIRDKEKSYFNLSLKADDLVNQMGMGYDLSNTLDAYVAKDTQYDQGLSSETCWGNPYTTEEMIDSYITKGFKSLRIPVTWHNHFIDKDYTIDPEWMERVKTVVDWAYSKGLYVILNTHHDDAQYSEENIPYGSGFYLLKRQRVESEKFLYNVWRQICIAFNNGYGERLIFESLNEPRLVGLEREWWCPPDNEQCLEANEVLREYNQLVLKTVRLSGGNNLVRFMMFPTMGASYDNLAKFNFKVPEDKEFNVNNDRIILSLHMYTPYNFALNEDKKFNVFTEEFQKELLDDFKYLYDNHILKGTHIIIGEMGTVDKNNMEERLKYAKFYVENARKFHLCSVLWVVSYDRKELSWESDELIDTYIEAAETPFSDKPY